MRRFILFLSLLLLPAALPAQSPISPPPDNYMLDSFNAAYARDSMAMAQEVEKLRRKHRQQKILAEKEKSKRKLTIVFIIGGLLIGIPLLALVIIFLVRRFS